MARLKEAGINDRAIVIYQWCLEHPVRFLAREVEGYKATPTNTKAMRLLLDRDLIMEANGKARPRLYKLKRTVPIDGCLDELPIDLDTTVTRYRVAPSVAGEHPTIANLKKYAIG